ncbi:MAG TPA: DUF5996 family protein [Caldimonas sp.]|nr:DUF5996 family protein [Caldimonas sp.]
MSTTWPTLDYGAWRDTALTLHLWAQIVGKVRLAFTPWLNHGWHVPLYVTAHGLGTSAIPGARGLLEIEFDFAAQRLIVRSSEGPDRGFALEPMTVATFYRRTLAELEAAGEPVRIVARPNEVPEPIAFADDDTHRSYDAAAVHRFWRALVEVDRVLKRFRTAFLGKSSPVHLWWGSFDLAVTRFSGRRAPPHPGGIPGLPDAVTREAYSHEVSSAGFWPGSDAYPHAAFYAYAYPSPAGYESAHIEPAEATWVAALGEWILPYDVVRASPDPAATLMRFLETTYRAAAGLAQWDPSLECALGEPRRPRVVPTNTAR